MEELRRNTLQSSRNFNLKGREWMNSLPCIYRRSNVLVIPMDLVLDTRDMQSPFERIIGSRRRLHLRCQKLIDNGIRALKVAVFARDDTVEERYGGLVVEGHAFAKEEFGACYSG